MATIRVGYTSEIVRIKCADPDHHRCRTRPGRPYQYSNSRILRDRKLARLGLPRDHRLPPRDDVGRAPELSYLLTGKESASARTNFERQQRTANGRTDMDKAESTSGGTREPQYNRCLEIKEKQGLTSLGLMTNQVWEDDPRRLTFLLARYKFVSKMLSGKKFVGELGCGDAFGTRIVMQSTEKVVAYDFDPVFVEDIRQRRLRTMAGRGALSRHPGSAASEPARWHL